MLVASDKKGQPQGSTDNAKPSWDNSASANETQKASKKLFVCAVLHGGIMIGIGWLIVRFLMRY